MLIVGTVPDSPPLLSTPTAELTGPERKEIKKISKKISNNHDAAGRSYEAALEEATDPSATVYDRSTLQDIRFGPGDDENAFYPPLAPPLLDHSDADHVAMLRMIFHVTVVAITMVHR